MFKFDIFIDKVFKEYGGKLVMQAKKQLATTSYGKKWPSLKNISSRPGDPPNNQSKAYSNSIRYGVKGRQMKFGAGNAKVNYVRWLESEGSRPNMTKAVEVCEKNLGKIVRGNLKVEEFMPKMSAFERVK